MSKAFGWHVKGSAADLTNRGYVSRLRITWHVRALSAGYKSVCEYPTITPVEYRGEMRLLVEGEVEDILETQWEES